MQYIAEREPLFCLSKSRIEVKGIIVCLNEPLKINNLKPTVIDCCNVAWAMVKYTPVQTIIFFLPHNFLTWHDI